MVYSARLPYAVYLVLLLSLNHCAVEPLLEHSPATKRVSLWSRLRFRVRPLHVLAGVSLALGGCSEGSLPSVQSVVFGEPDQLYIQPIQVCEDDGSGCAGVNLFADITAKILEQASLKVSFLSTNRLNTSRFLSINDSRDRSSIDYEFYELTRTGPAGAFGRHPNSTQNSGPINVWFVDTIEANNGLTQFGLAWVDANGVIVSKAALEFGQGGRTDTLAHEIGHNLGLRHATLGAGEANNLLTDGDRRNIPGSVDDIGTSGAGLSQLTDAQIAAVKRSSFVTRGTPGLIPTTEISEADAISVPEPNGWIGLAVLGLGIIMLVPRALAARD